MVANLGKLADSRAEQQRKSGRLTQTCLVADCVSAPLEVDERRGQVVRPVEFDDDADPGSRK